MESLKRKIAIGLCLLGSFLGLPNQSMGQSAILADYLAEGLKNNLALQQENMRYTQSIMALEEAKGFFMPEISVEASYLLVQGGRTLDFPVGDLLNPVYSTLNDLTDSQNFSSIENVNEQLMPNNFHDTRISLVQPLFNSDIYYGYKARESQISVQEAQRDTYVRELSKEIRTAYYSYIQTEDLLDIYDSTEVLLQEILRVNEVLYRNQKATRDVVYRAKSELEALYGQIAEAREQNYSAQSYFNFLLNRDLDEEILIDPQITQTDLVQENLLTLRESALRAREEFRQVRSGIDSQQYLLKRDKGAKLPKLSVGASAGFQGFGYRFNNDQAYWLAQFNLSIPLFTGFRNNTRVQMAQLEIEQSQTQLSELQQQIQLQVIQSYRAYQSALAQVKARGASLENARVSFDILQKKYQQGQALLVELLDARTQFTNAQIEENVARYAVLIRKAELERIAAL